MGSISSIILRLNQIINRLRLRNKNFTIIPNTCMGGVMYHQLGQKFNSPFINCGIIEPKEFIIFASNIKYYLSLPIEFEPSQFDYPVGVLRGEYGDARVHFGHDHSEKEAKEKWDKRVSRVDYNNLFLLMDADNSPDEYVYEFDKLPVENKALISMKEYPELKTVFTIKNPHYKQGDLLKKKLCNDSLYWFELFDYVHFFNTGKVRGRRIFKNS